MKRKILMITLTTILTTTLCGCSPTSTIYKLENLFEFGIKGTDPMIDDNNVTGEFIEGALSNDAKEQERIDAKSAYTEAEKRHDERVKANGGISSSVNLDDQYKSAQEELDRAQDKLNKAQDNKNKTQDNKDKSQDKEESNYNNFFDKKPKSSNQPTPNNCDPNEEVRENTTDSKHSIWEYLKIRLGNWYKEYKEEHSNPNN